jgi:hypothetical protein
MEEHPSSSRLAFRKTSDLKPSLYNAGNVNRVCPADLGYYMVYKIRQSFYEVLRRGSTEKSSLR